MLEIIGGIFIGIGIETASLISYIFYKRRQSKPPITYNEVFDINTESLGDSTSSIANNTSIPNNPSIPSIPIISGIVNNTSNTSISIGYNDL